MPIYADDPNEEPLIEADLDEVIFWEGLMRECEDEERATDCYRLKPEAEPEPDKVLEATLTFVK